LELNRDITLLSQLKMKGRTGYRMLQLVLM